MNEREPAWPAECEAENAPHPPLPCAAPWHTALAGSCRSPRRGSVVRRRQGGELGRLSGVYGRLRPIVNRFVPRYAGESWGRSQGISRQELLRRVSTISMVSCSKNTCIIASPCCYCRAVPLFCMPLFLDLHSIPGHRTGGARVRIPSLSGKFTSLKFPCQWLCHRPAVPLFLLCHFCVPILFVKFFNDSTIRNSKK